MKLRWLALAFLYVSCAPSPSAARDARIAVARVGDVTRIACTRRDGITFTLRTRAACRVARDGNCAIRRPQGGLRSSGCGPRARAARRAAKAAPPRRGIRR